MKITKQLLNSPLHAIVGLELLATGLILLTNRRYFFWPRWPELVTTVENYIVIGLSMIYWAISTEKF